MLRRSGAHAPTGSASTAPHQKNNLAIVYMEPDDNVDAWKAWETDTNDNYRWVKGRITLSKVRDQEHDHFKICMLLEEKAEQYVVTKEMSKKTKPPVPHWHIVARLHIKDAQEIRGYLRTHYYSRGWMFTPYTDKQLISRSSMYYIGYALKETDEPDGELLSWKLEHDINDYYDHYWKEKGTVSDTFLNFAKARITEYDDLAILDMILDYYQHVKIGYDKKSINKLFHLVRGHLFPELEKKWVRENKMLLIE